LPGPSLEHQHAIVTGASSGIGRAVAVALAGAGARVTVNYLTGDDAASEVVAEILGRGGEAIAVQADVSRPDDCRRLFEAAEARFGPVDILVANAGIQRDSPFGDMTLEDWQAVIDVNLTGQFLCAQQAVGRFRRRGPVAASSALGKILFMNSVHQAVPWAGHANYAASKGGLHMLMATMAQELAPEKIRVNAIAPGAIRTPINEDAWADPDAFQDLLVKIPYGRIGEPEDVARAAVWLASDQSDYVVGTTLFVDGGMMLYPEFRKGG
jgi:glucose 1-dehydrogenase